MCGLVAYGKPASQRASSGDASSLGSVCPSGSALSPAREVGLRCARLSPSPGHCEGSALPWAQESEAPGVGCGDASRNALGSCLMTLACRAQAAALGLQTRLSSTCRGYDSQVQGLQSYVFLGLHLCHKPLPHPPCPLPHHVCAARKELLQDPLPTPGTKPGHQQRGARGCDRDIHPLRALTACPCVCTRE